MLKRLRLYPLTITAILALTACQGDSVEERGESLPSSGKALVTLRIATDNGKALTRAWEDVNAKTVPDRTEMMYSWIVLITDGSTIKYKYIGSPAETKAEIDDVCTNVEMTSGTYSVYSFANISEASLKSLLSLSSLEPNTALADATVAAATATINGNGFVPSETNGIPMSNKQTLTVPTSGSITQDLIVVRMLAKMEVSLKNETGKAATVQSFTISDITTNAANNLKLLPNLTDGANTMEAVHGDIQPNLTTSATASDFTVNVNKTIAKDATEIVSFYINESATPTNPDGLFYLTVRMNDTDYRYALINSQSNNTTGANYKWNYIARNDYRILPIVLDEYKLELIPYDFPAIGVYPVSVREIESDLYEMTFHDYGHFHLVPKVTKTSGTPTAVPYSTDETPSGTAWTLNTDFAGSWKTAAAKGSAWLDADGITANGFYRNQTATVDGDEVGGAPVWYSNTSSPQWDPAGGSSYAPFIFGYIADPGSAMSADKTIYHEFLVKLYVAGTYRRDILYRFYMVLDKDQMMYTRGLQHSAARSPHNMKCTII